MAQLSLGTKLSLNGKAKYCAITFSRITLSSVMDYTSLVSVILVNVVRLSVILVIVNMLKVAFLSVSM